MQREIPKGQNIRYIFPAIGLFTAIGMHVIWNAAAVYLGKFIGDSSGLLALALNAAIFGGAGLLFFIAAYVFAASRERRVLVTYLGEEVGKGFVESDELDSFQQRLDQLRYELGGLFRFGLKVYFRRKALRRAQVELAFRKWHLAQGEAVRGSGRFDRYIKDTRERIRDARNELNTLESRTRAPSGQYPAVKPDDADVQT